MVDTAISQDVNNRQDSWWQALTRHEQEEYLKEHPASKFSVTAKNKTEPVDKDSIESKPSEPRSSGAKWYLRKNMVEAAPDRSDLPEHIKAMKLPPGWSKLQYNPDPDADLVAIGRDNKNRDQYVYSETFITRNQALKFARIREIDAKFDSMALQTVKDQKSSNKTKAEHALVAELIFRTGIRPGSNEDTGAEKKAYGATTLEARHVVKTKEGVRLQFIGKKGVNLDIPINDKRLASLLLKRKANLQDDDKLFSGVSDSTLRDYVHGLGGGNFKVKDIRTAYGTRLARIALADLISPEPNNDKSYRKTVLEVGKKVAKALGNRPEIALSAYIDSSVFSSIRASAGV